MLKPASWVLIWGAAVLIAIFLVFPGQSPKVDAAQLNEILHTVEQAHGRPEGSSESGWPPYVVLSEQGDVLYRSADGLSGDMWSAVSRRDTVLPANFGDERGIVIVFQDLQRRPDPLQWTAAAAVLGFAALAFFLSRNMRCRLLRPLEDLTHTAEQIAKGNLEIALPMDRGNVLGAFTDTFDMMRAELARAREAEERAASEKKELIAKLSHDLKTPIASIRAAGELGALKAQDAAERDRYEQIAGQAVRMNLLVTNLLNAAVAEQTELTVASRAVTGEEIAAMLEGADYLHALTAVRIPYCTALADPVRLLQVFDNIVSNAYKYAPGPLHAEGFLDADEVLITIEDEGGGVPVDEIGFLHTRYYRGSNSAGTEGAGLGLNICDQLLRAMGGELIVRNGECGLSVMAVLPLAGRLLRNS